MTKQLLKQILIDTDKNFLKWAIRAILTWNNSIKPKKLIQIQGKADKIIPVRFTTPDLALLTGGHLMVYNKSETISKLLAELLN